MLQLILVGAVFAGLFYYFAIKPMSYWKDRGVKQGNPLWLVGDNWGTVIGKDSFTDMVLSVYNAVPGVRYSGMYQFTVPTLLLKDLELIKQIGVKEFDSFMDHRSFVPEEADPLFGKNLLQLKGQRWRDMRPVLSPSFTSSKMRSMFVLMSDCAKNFSNFFTKKHEDVIDVEMKDIFTRFTNDVIATTAFGIKTNSLEDQNNEFYNMGKDATDFSGFWKTVKFFGFLVVPKLYEIFKIPLFDKHVSKYFSELIEDTIKTREAKGIVRPDMLNLLIEARKGVQHKEDHNVVDTGFAVVKEADLGSKGSIRDMTNIDIAAHAMIFFFAGFDTVSALMCFMSYELAVHPDIQKRLRKEIEETLLECGGTLTYEAVLKMKYLDMVVCETLRKWPNVIAVDRICTKPYTIPPENPEEKPLHIEKGTVIWLPTFAIHRDPQYWPDPDRFDPERFSEENKGDINPYAYIPFGVGPRNCIGSRFALLETKVVFFHLLSNFEIVPTAKTRIPLKISKKQFNLTADGGFWCGLKRLKK